MSFLALHAFPVTIALLGCSTFQIPVATSLMQIASVIWAMFLDGCHKKPARRFIFLEQKGPMNLMPKRKPKPQSDRQIERVANQRKYGSWRDVMAESVHLRCGGCGNHVSIKGDVTGKTCKRCGTPLSSAR